MPVQTINISIWTPSITHKTEDSNSKDENKRVSASKMLREVETCGRPGAAVMPAAAARARSTPAAHIYICIYSTP